MRLEPSTTWTKLFALSLATVCSVTLAGCVGDEPLDEDEDVVADPVVLAALGPNQQLVRKGSNKCLDIDAAGTADGTNIQQWSCNGTNAQKFALDDRGGGIFRLVNPSSGKCVDVAGAGTSNGTNVQLWTCNTSGAQTFRLQNASGGYSQVVNTKSNKCVDVASGSSSDGANVRIWSCSSSSAAQRWKLEPTGGGNPPPPPPPPPGTWRKANLTNFESYPDPGSEECEEFNGCLWSGYFAFVDGKQTENWVMSRNIAAVHSRDAQEFKLKTLRLKQGTKQIDVVVYDMCADSDCSGCCTQNASQTGFLIDIEKYTMGRFGSGDGIVDWTCLDCQ